MSTNQSRRGFLKALSLASAATLIPNVVLGQTILKGATAAENAHNLVKWKFSGSHWGAFRAKIAGDKLLEVKPFEFDQHPTDMIYNIPGLVYNSSRVRYPMVRLDWFKHGHKSDTAQRGDNRFVRVTWDQALDLVYNELERIQTQYGAWALHIGNVGWRSVGQLHSCGNNMLRALAMHGSGVTTAGDYSTGAGQTILPYVLGSTEVYSQGTSWPLILDNSDLIVFWGNDPIKNLQVGWNTETHEAFAYYEQLRDKIAKGEIQVISVDPVKSKTQNFLGCEQQYVNPLTDVALMLAIAHTMVKENLHDQDFLATYTVGFDQFEPYLMGKTVDNIEKMPEWAEPICGVKADRIRELARLFAKGRTQLIFGWATQRQQHGEQPYWMAAVLASMIGQIGLPGGGISYSHHYCSVGVPTSGASMPGAFPLALDFGRTAKYDQPDYQGYSSTIPVARVVDALLEPGKEINYNGSTVKLPPYKMAIFSGANQWHRQQDRNKMKRAYQKLETVVYTDYNWTASCRFADIVLPACTPYERNDIDIYGTYSNRGVIAMHKLVDPLYHSKPDLEIWAQFAKRLGREEEYRQGLTEMEWIEKLYNECKAENAVKGFEMPEFTKFWEDGYVLFPDGPLWVRHAAFREDPEVNALGTPSGFIEIFSRKIAAYHYDNCKGHPVWLEKNERSHGGPNSEKYPFWLQSPHPDSRLHSQMCEIDSARAKYSIADREPVYMNEEDAKAKGIKHGDVVLVFNDRGSLIAGANISPNFPKGVLRIFEGAWYGPLNAEVGSVDTYGDPNTVTMDVGTSDLAQATSANTCIVDIRKYEGPAPDVTSFGGPIEVDPIV